MWLLIQSCSICVSQDCGFYIPFYLVTEATARFLLLHFFPSFFPPYIFFSNRLKVGQ